MGFFSRLFSTNQKTDQSLNSELASGLATDSTDILNQPIEDEYTQVGISRVVTEEEKELVSLIASAIFAGDHPDAQIRVQTVIGIDADKEAAAVIATAIAARDYPNAAFRLVSVEER